MRASQVSLLILVVGVALTATGCGIFGGKPTPVYFDEDRTYVNWLASSQEECDQLNDQGINCFQMVEFFTDGSAEIMMTDIVHRGSYTLTSENTQIVLTMGDNPELPEEITFEVLSDGAQLRDSLTDSTWDLE